MDTSNFDNTDNFSRGLKVRSEVLGEEYVAASIAKGASDPFTRKLQQFVTENAWGTVWCDETLDRKTRSMLNVVMLAALNRMHEWELHFRGAIVNGVSRNELKAILNQIAIYCGIPASVECHRIAKRVFNEVDSE